MAGPNRQFTVGKNGANLVVLELSRAGSTKVGQRQSCAAMPSKLSCGLACYGHENIDHSG